MATQRRCPPQKSGLAWWGGPSRFNCGKAFFSSEEEVAEVVSGLVRSFKDGLSELSSSLQDLGWSSRQVEEKAIDVEEEEELEEPECPECTAKALRPCPALGAVPRGLTSALEQQIRAARCGHVLFPSLFNFISGYDGGVTSFAVIQLTDAQLVGSSMSVLGAWDVGAVVSSRVCGALCGSMLVLFNQQDPSSRDVLIWSAMGLTVISAASFFAPSRKYLLLLRFLAGLAEGVSSPAKVAYSTETIQAELRGPATGVRLATFGAGASVGVVLGALLRHFPGAWHVMFGAAALPSIVAGVGMLSLPQSPRWLVHSGGGAPAERRARALNALQALRPSIVDRTPEETHVLLEHELDSMCAGMEDGEEGEISPACVTWEFLTSPATEISTWVMFFKQANGSVAITTYLAPVLAALGFKEFTTLGVVLMVVRSASTPIGILLMDRLGRRGTLLLGTLGSSASMVALAATHVLGAAAPASMMNAAFGCLVASTAFFELCLATTPFTLTSELYTQQFRQHGLALSHVCNYAVKAAGMQLFPLVLSCGGLLPLWTIFALVNGAGFVVIFRIVPETSGRSLEDVAQELKLQALTAEGECK